MSSAPLTPDNEGDHPPEDDDPTAAAPYSQPYTVEDFDPEHEKQDLHDGEEDEDAEGN